MKAPVLIISMMLLVSSSVANGVEHTLFDAVLDRYVNEAGWVDYNGLANDRDEFDQYLELLRSNHPNKSWSREEQLAYWINAYNAFTLELILKNYPVESIKDIGAWIQIPFVNTPWDIKFIEIGDEKYDLNNIEHDILRKEFDEPRIHFAIVCASYSCPRLSREAYKAEKIDRQLDEAARHFLNDSRKNKITAENPMVSKIFSWFGGDFKKETTLIQFLNGYTNTQINSDADVDFLDYDWSLNDQKALN